TRQRDLASRRRRDGCEGSRTRRWAPVHAPHRYAIAFPHDLGRLMSPAYGRRFEAIASPDPQEACDPEVMIDFVARIADNRFRTELRLVTRSWLSATMSVFQDEIGFLGGAHLSGFLRGAHLSVAYEHVGIRRPVNKVEQPT
ncbi:hypothetical protein, partial [Paraburkholderia sp. BR14374]|uniref:hypothetical protein n=1 Tax=Paraburkholderia sp. BR14374 TaxID=3237007 RepID=UPI0034CE783A